MTSTYRNSVISLLWIGLLFAVPGISLAQNAVSFSVSPTIFDMTAAPGQTWRSSIRVINANPFEMTMFVKVVNFTPKGESGVPQFIPVEESSPQSATLAQWITTDQEIKVPAEKTFELPLTIVVPSDAPPGGHFAAVMISTTPPKGAESQTKVETSQVISALLFLRVTGDVTEDASIRSFRSTNLILSKPEATFELRIQNDGNVHVQPQGEIVITNMWGQERGVIAVNQQTLFGNVLPKSVRKYAFSWSGEWSISDIGRYTAVANLAYGADARQFMNATTTFWLVPWKPILLVLAMLGSFIALLIWSIKLYIRRMLSIAGVSVADTQRPIRESLKTKEISVAAPIEAGILDLRSRLKDTEGVKMSTSAIIVFIKAYRTFFVIVLAIIFFIGLVVWFVQEAATPTREFEVTYLDQPGATDEAADDKEAPLSIHIINQAGSTLGIDTTVKTLEDQGYKVTIGEESDVESENTSIIYQTVYANEALSLSRMFDGALLSAFDGAESDVSYPITIYLGKDAIQN